MNIFFHILVNNVMPIFILIGLGFAISKKFDLNIRTLSKLNFYLFTPGFIFYNLYTTSLNLNMIKILLFCILYLVISDIMSKIISRIRKYDMGLTSAFKNSVMFNNTGNIGLSLITLIFGSAPFVVNGQTPYLTQALGAQVMIMVFMDLTMNTLGFYNAGRAKRNFKSSVDQILSMPIIYVVTLALFLRYMRLDITTTPLWSTIVYIKGGLVPVSLLTLGVQLSKTEFDFKNINVYISAFTRLIIGPIIALIFIYLFGFTGVIAQTVLIAYSVPTAVTTALIAVECDNNQNFASQAVMISTIFSSVTLTLSIYMAGVFFPVT
jgi:malate permease and related proteins